MSSSVKTRRTSPCSQGEVIKVIAVIEEAQSVLPRNLSDTSPFVTWVKEGRKYDLGCILITQQPGSIASELLSQGDNFFAFHLLSANDLKALQVANAHFSNDILASVLNEPIKGNAYYWSAPGQPFVLSAKIESFEEYAKEKKADLRLIAQTPVEEYEKAWPSLDHIIVDAVRGVIEHAPEVSVKLVKSVNGKPIEGYYAVNCWNLRFSLAQLLEIDNLPQYCDRFEDGRLALKHEYTERALRRNELVKKKAVLFQINGDGKRTEFYVVRRDRLSLNGKPIKEAVELTTK
ncbi:MAG: ATP-binding protein [Actinobacteria bacterium]|nr:ATP-binding protein [Actinomycetota bacterium]